MRLLRSMAIAGMALGAYSVYATRAYRLRTVYVPMRAGVPPLSVLHVSDTHLTAGKRKLVRWLDGLPEALGELPDVVLATGDLIEDNSGIEPIVEALGRIEARLGRFYVLGSHDYYQASVKGFARSAFTRWSGSKPPRLSAAADTARLEESLQAKGWIPLTNTTTTIATEGGLVRLSGIDDPFLQRHRTDHIRRTVGETLAIGLVHAPDIVSEWMLAGFDLVLAGHTHGGQVRVPGLGALVTNCKLPAGLASGLNRVGGGWLHVSPGLGTGKFSQVRFLAPPEATLLRLVPATPV